MSEPVENLEPPEPPEPTPIPTPLEAALYPDSCAAWTTTVKPGSATAKVLALLDPGRLSQAGRVDALVALERLAAWTAARQLAVLAAMADDPPPPAGDPGSREAVARKLERSWVKEDVRAALGESTLGAGNRLRDAAQLVHDLPDTLTALEQGRIRAGHARAVADMVRTLDRDAAREVEQAVLPDPAEAGEPMPVMASFRRKLRREVIKADPRTAEQKATKAAEDRDVWVMPQEDGMAFLGAPLPAEGAETVYAAVSAKADADQVPDDARTKAQQRADALVGLCADYLNRGCRGGVKIEKDPARGCRAGVKIENDTARGCRAGVKIEKDTSGPGPVPRYHGLRPSVQVSVALSTLLGLDEQPGELDGYGPIPAAVARRIAADPTGTWRRLVTDELGRLIDYGRTTYRPPADLAQYVIARDRTCRAPGCNQPAAKSDLHHTVPFSQGGPTNAEHLTPACQHDHYGVHEAGWKVTRLQDGTVEWTAPTGHTYRVPPATYPIDTTSRQPEPAEGEDRNGHASPGDHASTPAEGQDQNRQASAPDGGAGHDQGEDQTDHGDSEDSDQPPF